ncbi:MAG TPA: LLM class flavin-dependent oxidoreductase [Noviherbaspirillum sp.]|uniref:LLM class flavin-dependent oxidoreductase n=1 Tax=Noviherbaspirillum sp. TaxID=1926288 RepID=UPI002D529464|nr:LLM class flavin-dependent oxidoreductase [Noviherbaspirillum sp.]HYD96993.1 LLM class flavin-dependent oxidoreductase [Noviherbaspirillum sp.]
MKQFKDIPLSILDLAPIQQGGTAADAFQRTLDLARHADRWGYHRYWLAEHHGMPAIASAATAVAISYVAAGTTRIRVGAGGVMLPNHAPLVVAEQFGTLESLYPGRIDLGLGRAPGSNQLVARALRRGLQADGEEFPQLLAELRGYFRPRGTDSGAARVRAVPGEGLSIPIWLLGSSDFSARLAGHLGLPFAFAGQFSPAYLQEALALYRHCFQPSDALQKPHVMVGLNVFAADSDEEARRLSTTHQQMHVNLIRGLPGQMPPPVDSMDGLWSPLEQASVEATLRVSITGAPDTVRRRLQAFIDDTQADELIVNTMIFDHAARLRSYEILAQLAHS